MTVKKFQARITETTKQCYKCRIDKTFNNFSKSKRGKIGLSSYCKECFLKFYKPSKEQYKRYTKKYRLENREVYLEKHRLRQFERKQNIKVVTDPSVTKELIVEIYSRENCYYCNKYVEYENRTLEHKQPLSKGGLHSDSNLEMVCDSCNCSKRNMTEKEFKEKINDKCYNN